MFAISRFKTDELVIMFFRCLCTILYALPAFGQNLAVYVGLGSLSVGAIIELPLLLLILLLFDFCIREAFLMENLMDLSCLLITALEYPLLMSFLLCWSNIMDRFIFSELVRRNLVASPMTMPLPVPGGW